MYNLKDMIDPCKKCGCTSKECSFCNRVDKKQPKFKDMYRHTDDKEKKYENLAEILEFKLARRRNSYILIDVSKIVIDSIKNKKSVD